jgi:hypothetical protein
MLGRRRWLLHRSWLLAALAGGLAGCASHPLPEDFSRASTVDIVRSIRCEARMGILRLAPEEIATAEPIIKATVIGYDFVFDISEENTAGGVKDNKGVPVDLTSFARGDKFSLDFTGSASLDRRNQRRFKIIEPLKDLLKREAEDGCAGLTARKSHLYPIAGSIGMDEVVRTYLKLEMLTELQKRKLEVSPGGQAKAKPAFPTKESNIVFSDEIDFTTRLTTGTTATLVLDAVVGRLKVTNASLATGASRVDKHQVIVALARDRIDVPEAPSPAKAGTKSGTKETDFRKLTIDAASSKKPAGDSEKIERAQAFRKWALASDSVPDPRVQAKLIQLDEDAATRVAMELQRRRSLNEDENVAAVALGQRLLDLLKTP